MTTSIIAALDDPRLFGRHFRDKATWSAWRSYLSALCGLPMWDAEAAIYRECTGRTTLPTKPFSESWLICGRRSGKSRILALLAAYLSTFIDWRPQLAPGETGYIVLLAADRKQARAIHGYTKAFLTQTPLLASRVLRETTEEIELTQNVTIEIATSSYKSIRGRTVIAALCDEIAFWSIDSDSQNPDSEVLIALRPAMSTIKGSMLFCASSPYARRGALWDAHRTWYGRDDASALVWQASTATMNPTMSVEFLDNEYSKDPQSAAAEYGGQFRTDIENFVSKEVVDAVTIPGRYEIQPVPGVRYFAFTDPSGGSGDSFTCAIAHHQGDGMAVLDVMLERRSPFSPKSVVEEFGATLRRYGISSVTGDRYAGEWPREAFRDSGFSYELSEKPKSDLYRDLLPILNSGKCELLDIPRLHNQLVGLERRTARSGKDSIDHAPGGRDDVANALAGVLAMTQGPGFNLKMWLALGANAGDNTGNAGVVY